MVAPFADPESSMHCSLHVKRMAVSQMVAQQEFMVLERLAQHSVPAWLELNAPTPLFMAAMHAASQSLAGSLWNGIGYDIRRPYAAAQRQGAVPHRRAGWTQYSAVPAKGYVPPTMDRAGASSYVVVGGPSQAAYAGTSIGSSGSLQFVDTDLRLAWPSLSDPLLVSRMFGPLAWWSTRQLESLVGFYLEPEDGDGASGNFRYKRLVLPGHTHQQRLWELVGSDRWVGTVKGRAGKHARRRWRQRGQWWVDWWRIWEAVWKKQWQWEQELWRDGEAIEEEEKNKNKRRREEEEGEGKEEAETSDSHAIVQELLEKRAALDHPFPPLSASAVVASFKNAGLDPCKASMLLELGHVPQKLRVSPSANGNPMVTAAAVSLPLELRQQLVPNAAGEGAEVARSSALGEDDKTVETLQLLAPHLHSLVGSSLERTMDPASRVWLLRDVESSAVYWDSPLLDAHAGAQHDTTCFIDEEWERVKGPRSGAWLWRSPAGVELAESDLFKWSRDQLAERWRAKLTGSKKAAKKETADNEFVGTPQAFPLALYCDVPHVTPDRLNVVRMGMPHEDKEEEHVEFEDEQSAHTAAHLSDRHGEFLQSAYNLTKRSVVPEPRKLHATEKEGTVEEKEEGEGEDAGSEEEASEEEREAAVPKLREQWVSGPFGKSTQVINPDLLITAVRASGVSWLAISLHATNINRDRATRAYAFALSLRPNDPVLHFGYGMLLQVRLLLLWY